MTLSPSRADTVVLVSTAKRPRFLRTALQSIAAQTGRDRILEVRVMENGGDRTSEKVCAEFAGRLPIVYVYRDPPMDIVSHGKVIAEDTYPGRYIAILHDDDWWAPEHLASSLKAMEETGAIASYAAFFYVMEEKGPLGWHDNLLFWVASGYRSVLENWVLGMKELMVANIGGLPGHYSSLVCEATAWRNCADILYQKNVFDTDRMLSVALTRFGNVVYRPLPTVYIRKHTAQDSQTRVNNDDQMKQLGLTTLWIFAVADVNKIDLMAEFRRIVDACPYQHRYAVSLQYAKPWLYRALRKKPGLPKLVIDLWVKVEKSDARAKAQQALKAREEGQAEDGAEAPTEEQAA